MSRFAALFLILCLLILTACGNAASFVPTPSPSLSMVTEPSLTPLPATPTASITPQPTATPVLPSLTPTAVPKTSSHYSIRLDLSYDRKSASVQMQIDYTNRSQDLISGLRLMIPPMAYPGAFTLKTLQWAGGEPIQNPAWVENGISIQLPTPLQPGEHIALAITYELVFPSSASISGDRPIPFSYSLRQLNLVDWYPFIPPYRSGQGWLAHPNSYFGEHLVYDLADFDIELHLVDSRQDLIVAASAPARQEAGNIRHYSLEKARNFAISISHEYKTATILVRNVEITSYYFAAHALAGEAAPQITADAMTLFDELFVPYPHSTLAVVEAEFLDGMEYDGLFFVSRGMYNLYTGTPGEYFHALVVHECAHQWWYGLIGNDQAMEPWLDEGLSTYSELLYYEHYHPEALDWWWQIRINYYKPSGWINSSVYDFLGYANNYELYRNAVYFNAAVFLADLRQVTGEEAFFAFLKDYAQRYAGEIANGQDFFDVLSLHNRADLNPLLTKYFKSR